jgi:hypothetical protein
MAAGDFRIRGRSTADFPPQVGILGIEGDAGTAGEELASPAQTDAGITFCNVPKAKKKIRQNSEMMSKYNSLAAWNPEM